jgi:hypothetical protein
VGWVIDTSLWIAVERGALSAADIRAITREEPVYLSPVNVAEIQFGLDLLPPGSKKQRATAMLGRKGSTRSRQQPLACGSGDSTRFLATHVERQRLCRHCGIETGRSEGAVGPATFQHAPSWRRLR